MAYARFKQLRSKLKTLHLKKKINILPCESVIVDETTGRGSKPVPSDLKHIAARPNCYKVFWLNLVQI